MEKDWTEFHEERDKVCHCFAHRYSPSTLAPGTRYALLYLLNEWMNEWTRSSTVELE